MTSLQLPLTRNRAQRSGLNNFGGKESARKISFILVLVYVRDFLLSWSFALFDMPKTSRENTKEEIKLLLTCQSRPLTFNRGYRLRSHLVPKYDS